VISRGKTETEIGGGEGTLEANEAIKGEIG
jgi:hypothetical protein